jgi:hypothetical protein
MERFFGNKGGRMNLSELRKLETGDEIVFTSPFPVFELGKRYKVKKTDVGTWVITGTGRNYRLGIMLDLCNYFEPLSKILAVKEDDPLVAFKF